MQVCKVCKACRGEDAVLPGPTAFGVTASSPCTAPSKTGDARESVFAAGLEEDRVFSSASLAHLAYLHGDPLESAWLRGKEAWGTLHTAVAYEERRAGALGRSRAQTTRQDSSASPPPPPGRHLTHRPRAALVVLEAWIIETGARKPGSRAPVASWESRSACRLSRMLRRAGSAHALG